MLMLPLIVPADPPEMPMHLLVVLPAVFRIIGRVVGLLAPGERLSCGGPANVSWSVTDLDELLDVDRDRR